MGNGEMVPFRVNAPPAIEPIDLALVPDCVREESAELRKRREVAAKQIESYEDWYFAPSFASVMVGLFLLVASMMAVAEGHGWIALIRLTFAIGCFSLIYVVASTVKRLPGYKAHFARKIVCEKRIVELDALDRLTGNKKNAELLTEEARSFNDDLKKLPAWMLDEHTRAKILERRRELTDRINTFRQGLLPAPETPEPKLLSPPDAA